VVFKKIIKLIWNFTSIQSELNDNLKKGFANVVVNEKNVDITWYTF
jgi:hypothetical protein